MKINIKKPVVLLLGLIMMVAVTAGCSQNTENDKSYDLNKINNEVTGRNVDFAFDIFREINREEKAENIFISPLSISTALTMTYNGALGDTLAQMEKGLRYEGLIIHEVNETYSNLLPYLSQTDKKVELNICNSIWYRQGEAIKEEFISTNQNVFDAEVKEADFSDPETVNAINKWIKESTKGKIDKMIDPPIPDQVVMYLINAVYFKGEWAAQFNIEDTFQTDFNGIDGFQTIDMMSMKGEVEYGEGYDYKAVRLPYGEGKTAMYFILPEAGQDIDSFIRTMDSDKFNSVKDTLKNTEDVLLQVPKFKMEYGIKKLNDPLIAMGMELPFSAEADLSGIREGLFISEVLHKAVIEVNEEGSEAAGVTVVIVAETAAQEPVTFIADRPFLFLIEEEATGSILFMGKYCNAP